MFSHGNLHTAASGPIKEEEAKHEMMEIQILIEWFKMNNDCGHVQRTDVLHQDVQPTQQPADYIHTYYYYYYTSSMKLQNCRLSTWKKKKKNKNKKQT